MYYTIYNLYDNNNTIVSGRPNHIRFETNTFTYVGGIGGKGCAKTFASIMTIYFMVVTHIISKITSPSAIVLLQYKLNL